MRKIYINFNADVKDAGGKTAADKKEGGKTLAATGDDNAVKTKVLCAEIKQYIPDEEDAEDGRKPGTYIVCKSKVPKDPRFKIRGTEDEPITVGTMYLTMDYADAKKSFALGDDLTKVLKWGEVDEDRSTDTTIVRELIPIE